MRDDEIDNFLREINNSIKGVKIFSLIAKDERNIINEQARVFHDIIKISYLKNDLKVINEILQENTNSRVIYLNPKGKKIIRLGGWLKYCELEEKKELKQEEKESYDLKISAFQAKNRLLPYYVSGLSILISLISLWNPIHTSIGNDESEKYKVIENDKSSNKNLIPELKKPI